MAIRKTSRNIVIGGVALLVLYILMQRKPIETSVPTIEENPVESCAKRKQDFFLRIVVLTYNRPKGLANCLQSLAEADYFGDTVDLDIWIDRNKDNILDTATYDAAISFNWSHGKMTVHSHPAHVGLYGQWLSTWSPTNWTCPEENAFFAEDDIVVSKAYYKWLKNMHLFYSNRTDISGFSLQKQITMAGPKTYRTISLPEKHSVFLYRIYGTWGFSPNKNVWQKFLAWYNEIKHDRYFQPYVPGILPTGWYKDHQKKNKADEMWEIWFIYFNHIKDLYCLYPNHKDLDLVINKELPGLHYSKNKKISTKSLMKNLTIHGYERSPMIIDYDGSVLSNKKLPFSTL